MKLTTILVLAKEGQATEQPFHTAQIVQPNSPQATGSDWLNEHAIYETETVNNQLYTCCCGGCYTCENENHPDTEGIKQHC